MRGQPIQEKMTQTFFWLSPIAIGILAVSNFPAAEKALWGLPVAAPVLAFIFAIWFLSFLGVLILTLASASFRENILHDYVLRRDRDEREASVSGEAAKKSILITMALSAVILIATTGRYNPNSDPSKASVTIGHFQLTDKVEERNTPEIPQSRAIGMSKTSIVLLIMLTQLASYYGMTISGLRKSA